MKHRNILKALNEALGVILVLIVVSIFICLVGMVSVSISGDETDPYSEGTHWQYQIRCENGFVYKVRGREGAIQILNSDGTPLRCGQKIY